MPKLTEPADRDRIVLDHLHLVKAIAFRIRASLPVHTDLDDLAAAGVMGLIDAANKYNASKQAAFSTYAKHRIRGAILDSLRQLDWASRDMRRQQKLVAKAISELTTILQRNPSDIEIAERVGIDLASCRRSMTALNSGGPISISHFANDDGAFALPDYPADPTTHPDFMLGRKELLGVLKEGVHRLPERHQKIVMMYYEDEMSMKQIGSLLGINESRVSQIHKSAISKMADHFRSKGIIFP
jgi:RNA polymerase sigma factor for flagellar operon FliA